MNLESKIESILFFKGEPVSFSKLAEILGEDAKTIEEAISRLKEGLSGRGIRLIINEDKAMLGTAPEMSELIEKMHKDELSRELTKSSLEALAIVLYKKGATRAEIDYIRGVNSSFILRNLSIRGLVERKTHPSDSRKYIYMPTFELYSYLGITAEKELPDYDRVIGILSEQAEKAEEDRSQTSSSLED